jgi:hypothetical protein
MEDCIHIFIMNKKPQKYEYHKDVNCTPLPKDYIADQRRRSLKYTKK